MCVCERESEGKSERESARERERAGKRLKSLKNQTHSIKCSFGSFGRVKEGRGKGGEEWGGKGFMELGSKTPPPPPHSVSDRRVWRCPTPTLSYYILLKFTKSKIVVEDDVYTQECMGWL